MELSQLSGVGPVRAEHLRAVGIASLRDLLSAFPVRYEDHATVCPCAAAKEGPVMISGTVCQEPVLQRFHGLTRVSVRVQDASGFLPVQWFNCPWIKKVLHPGMPVRLYGRVIVRERGRFLQNPRIVSDSGLIPVYKSIPGIPQKSFRKLVAQALEETETLFPELLPDDYRRQHGLCGISAAIREIHFPSGPDTLDQARRRISFEQMLLYLTHISRIKNQHKKAAPVPDAHLATEEYWRSLPFQPTAAQRRVLTEIALDLEKDEAMKRLVQGDVGCGKTAVAFGAMAAVCLHGFQAAMMAPTEILAAQHYESACKTLSPLGIRCRLLTGSTRARERRDILEELASGECQAVFGTQALLTETVRYHRLGLVVTDEQHRFGVNQRTSLQQKGTDDQHRFPHVLVMSATPIPRSMALILYGDLDLSLIDELPEGRIPVRTRIVKESRREDLYRYLLQEVENGKQAYIVCPKVEDTEEEPEEGADSVEMIPDVRSAKGVYREMKTGLFTGQEIALTWGAQNSEEKQQTLQSFKEGKIRILVATTVVEVGVNNPNASIMIIENADRFGLSQLHQLRGRVGRGTLESWCFLISEKEDKLKIMRETNDGFLISKKDLEMRGPGEIIGTRQSGHIDETENSDIRLLDEVSQSVRALRASRNRTDRELLERLEKKAEALFRIREIGLN